MAETKTAELVPVQVYAQMSTPARVIAEVWQKQPNLTPQKQLDQLSELADRWQQNRFVCYFLAGSLLPKIYGAEAKWENVAKLRREQGFRFLSTKTEIYYSLRLTKKAKTLDDVEKNIHNMPELQAFVANDKSKSKNVEDIKLQRCISSLSSWAKQYLLIKPKPELDEGLKLLERINKIRDHLIKVLNLTS